MLGGLGLSIPGVGGLAGLGFRVPEELPKTYFHGHSSVMQPLLGPRVGLIPFSSGSGSL